MLDYRLLEANGRYEIRQYCRPPAVYLDHRAFRHFSENPELRQALVSAITDRDGTLVIGRLNLLEFTRVAYRSQLQDAERLVQDVLPMVFFLDIQIMDVVGRENTRGFGACGDMQMFEYYGKPLLDDFQQWRAIRLTLARALIGEILRDEHRALDLNDASDMMHTVVPCAYCDCVLIDSEWCDYIKRVRRRLAGRQHVAAVYSGKDDGMRRFLDALGAHPKDPRGAPPWPIAA
jgi:hypothetical protein